MLLTIEDDNEHVVAPVSNLVQAIGIDLGTTHSVVGYILPEDINKTVHLVPDTNGSYIHPSVIAKVDGCFVVGDMAVGIKDAIHSIKRKLSSDKELSSDAIYLSAEILRHLKQQAEKHLGHKVTNAVITVPAYFDERARMATKQAGELAGLNVLRLLAEPTAAALAYGLDNGDYGTFLVYDLGGGTFDVSLLRLTSGVFRVIGTGGHVNLGGDDFDKLFMQSFLHHVGYDLPLSDVDHKKLLQLARKTRHLLSTQNFADMTTWLPNRDVSHRFTKQDLETLIKPLIEQTITITQNVLRDADINASDLNGVLLVGGTTRTPLINDMLQQYFGKLPLRQIDPDLIVAVGSTYQAHALTFGSDTLLVDINPLSLGLETMGGIVEKIIPRNTLLPVIKTQNFTTYQDGQTGMVFHIVQGEREMATDCRSLATFTLNNIPPMIAGAAKIIVQFQLDVDGLLSVTAKETVTGLTQEIVVKPTFGLSTEEMREAIYRSLENGSNDMQKRLLSESKVLAQRVLQATEKILISDAKLIKDNDEIISINNAIEHLKISITTDDREIIENARTQLENVASPLIERRMNNALSHGVAGKKVDSF